MSSIIKVDQIQTAAGGVPTAADLGLNVSGAVLDHYYMQYGTSIYQASSTYSDSGLTLTVTPKSTSSKFVISYNVFLYFTTRSSGWSAAAGRILRDGTAIHTDGYALGRGAVYGTGAYVMQNSGDMFVDAPNTTSQVTYKVQFSTYQDWPVYIHQGDNKGFLSITEIAG